jgi:hypothetical protein
MKLRAPQILQNLYRDMRDRRMLLPALALVVALIAVPIVLSSSSSSTPAPAPAPTTNAGPESAIEPAVVTEQLGVTNYRKRLDQLVAKNPFRKHFMALPKSAKLTTSSSGGTSTTATSATSATGVSSSSLSGTSVPSSSTTSTATPSSTSSGSGSGNSNTSGSTKPHSSAFLAFRISVAVGPAGDLTERNRVKRLAFLPGDNRPLVAFIGVTEDAKRAIFAVSGDVSSVRGDGRCVPRRSACNFLELTQRDKASLQYSPQHDRTFNLKLRGIKLVRVDKPQGATSHKLGSEPILGPDG